MGLRDSIQGIVNNAILNSISDLNSVATFRTIVTGEYDPLTGVVEQLITTYPVTCVLGTVKQGDVADVSLVSTGRKILVPALQLSGVSVDALEDEVDVDGVSYDVKQVTLDTAGALFSFIVVAKQGTTIGGY